MVFPSPIRPEGRGYASIPSADDATDHGKTHSVSCFDLDDNRFRSPHALSIFDVEHSDEEDRWVTLGLDRSGSLLVVVHTFHQIDRALCGIRIISARRATANETREYGEGRI